MTVDQKFLCGFAGSVAIEIVVMHQLYLAINSDSRRRHILPPRYRRVGFWITRFLLAIVAGGLAVAYKIDEPLLAINIGAATPLILQALAQGLKNPL